MKNLKEQNKYVEVEIVDFGSPRPSSPTEQFIPRRNNRIFDEQSFVNIFSGFVAGRAGDGFHSVVSLQDMINIQNAINGKDGKEILSEAFAAEVESASTGKGSKLKNKLLDTLQKDKGTLKQGLLHVAKFVKLPKGVNPKSELTKEEILTKYVY